MKRTTKAEWVAVLAALGAVDREQYRKLREQAWKLAQSQGCSEKTN